jgi:predicted glycosyltransferase
MALKKKIWIDLDNSPHVPFFKPIIDELEKRGYSTMLTARRCFQVIELSDKFGLQCTVVGRHHGKHKFLKGLGLLFRAVQLIPRALKARPAIAVSHGSRAQLIASKLLRIPSVIIFDYEHAGGIPFVRADWLIAPEIIMENNSLKYKRYRVKTYPGIKEHVYVTHFKPDTSIFDELNLSKNKPIVTVRPPATEAHYHKHQSEELFEAAIDFLVSDPDCQMILLPRNDKQANYIRHSWPHWCDTRKIIIPDEVLDGLNLIWHSDLVISGGGTMNREAAALGVPVYSIFRGAIGAVDRYLANSDQLTLLESISDVKSKINLSRRTIPARPSLVNSPALERIVDGIISVLDQN